MSCQGGLGCASAEGPARAGLELVAEASAVEPVLAASLLRPGMPLAVMTRLALGQSEVTASRALELATCTAGRVDVVVFAFSALSSIEIDLEIGNDGENWSTFSSSILTQSGFARYRFRGVAARYLRFRYRAAGDPGGIGILTTTVNASES